MSQVAEGFTIHWISMKDAETGRVLWQDSGDWNRDELIEAHIPKSILQCRAVAREINFSSKAQIDEFSLTQVVSLQGQVIEQWDFQFGFVIPNSTNTWEQVIDAAPPEDMLPAEVLSGNLVIETTFFNKTEAIKRTRVKLFYD